jgi:hypothetical protein
MTEWRVVWTEDVMGDVQTLTSAPLDDITLVAAEIGRIYIHAEGDITNVSVEAREVTPWVSVFPTPPPVELKYRCQYNAQDRRV